MAKKRTYPSSLFSLPDVEAGAPLPARSHDFLISRGFAAASVSGGGRGLGPRLWDSTGLSVWALNSVLYWSGLEAVPAARLAVALGTHFHGVYGRSMGNIHHIATAILRQNPTLFDGLPPPDEKTGVTDDADYYSHVLRRSELYVQGKETKDDLCIEIVNRKFVFFGKPTSSDLSLALVINGWERGGEVDIRDLNAMEEQEAKEANNNANDARRQSLGRLSVNISLATREAYDRIYNIRLNTS